MTYSLVVSLSSIPPRFADLAPTLHSLLRQDAPADAILLWIPRSYRRFPEWDGRLPEVPEGVTILRCEEDFGPATKILPAVRWFEGQDVSIAFCDDDRLYTSDWLSSLLKASSLWPRCCIVAMGKDIPRHLGNPTRSAVRTPRAKLGEFTETTAVRDRESGFVDILQGYCGVMVRPEYFTSVVFDIPPVLWAVDDVWLSGNLEVNGVPIWLSSSVPLPAERQEIMGRAALQSALIDRHNRAQADAACIRYFRRNYGIWKTSKSSALLAFVLQMKIFGVRVVRGGSRRSMRALRRLIA